MDEQSNSTTTAVDVFSVIGNLINQSTDTDTDTDDQNTTSPRSFEEHRDAYYQHVEQHILDLQNSNSVDLNNADNRFSTAINLNSVRTRSVVVIGAGGIGSWTIRAIAGMGFQDITVYDDDIIEHHNVGPQGHSIVDLNTYKVDAMYNELLRMRGTVITRKKARVNSYSDMVQDLGFTPSILISAVDNMIIRNQLADELIRITVDTFDTEKPDLYIDLRMSMGEWNAFAFPLKSMKHTTLMDNYIVSDCALDADSNYNQIIPSIYCTDTEIRKVKSQCTVETTTKLLDKMLKDPEVLKLYNACGDVGYLIGEYSPLGINNELESFIYNNNGFSVRLLRYYKYTQHKVLKYYLDNECFEPSEGIQEACTERAIIYTGMNIGSYTAALIHWMISNQFCRNLAQLSCFLSPTDSNLPFHSAASFNSREWLFDLPNAKERKLQTRIKVLREENRKLQATVEDIKRLYRIPLYQCDC